MSLGLTFLIIRRELLALPRRRRFYWKRTGFVLAGSVCAIFCLLAAGSRNYTTVGLQVFSRLAVLALVVVVLIAPNTAMSAVQREKHERTLGLLFLSEITAGRFVLGKLLTSMFSTLMTVASFLPLLVLVVSFGGVSAAQIALAFVIVTGAMPFCIAIGIFAACTMRSEWATKNLLALLWAGYFIGLPAALALPHVVCGRMPSFDVIALVSPFAAMADLVRGQTLRTPLLNAGLNVMLSFPLLLTAQAIVSRLAVDKESAGAASRNAVSGRSWAVRSGAPARLGGGNPVTWKDYHFNYGGALSGWRKMIFLVAVVLAAIYVVPAISPGKKAATVLPVLFGFSVLVTFLGSLSRFARFFDAERKAARAFDVLLATDLTDGEIIWGKFNAVLLSVAPWAFLLFGSGILLLACNWGRMDIMSALLAFVEGCATWFVFASLSMWLSLRYRRNIAFGVCAAAWMIWNFAFRLFLLPFHHYSMDAVVFTDIVGLGVVGYYFILRVFSSLRRLAIEE